MDNYFRTEKRTSLYLISTILNHSTAFFLIVSASILITPNAEIDFYLVQCDWSSAPSANWKIDKKIAQSKDSERGIKLKNYR